MRKILVTGAQGQLARCIADAAPRYQNLALTFINRKQLDVTDSEAVAEYFDRHTFDACINTAAYTDVEKAESEPDRAFAVNAEGVANIARACAERNVLLLHVSTDYVFDGDKRAPYLETDTTNPINVYGASKLKGEQYVIDSGANYYILRTSWLYSQYGYNFYKTICRLAQEGRDLTVTTEQTGTPTNANDVARVLLQLAGENRGSYGVYHYSNSGSATWYDFAKTIIEIIPDFRDVNLAKTSHYPTFAARPKYSVMACDRVTSNFNIEVSDWENSLQQLVLKHIQ
jgi:dTDP-4-dehydrorhamnose reductase